jgi:biopolymer transport protein TolR
MGMTPKQGGFQPGRSTPTTLAEINVTPLVDVMLVLLIVFMISAPLMQQGIQVNLPKASADHLDQTPDQLVILIKESQEILLADRLIERGTLHQKLQAIASARPNVEVVIQADHEIPYGILAQVMAQVKKAGIHRVGLATQPGDSSSSL